MDLGWELGAEAAKEGADVDTHARRAALQNEATRDPYRGVTPRLPLRAVRVTKARTSFFTPTTPSEAGSPALVVAAVNSSEKGSTGARKRARPGAGTTPAPAQPDLAASSGDVSGGAPRAGPESDEDLDDVMPAATSTRPAARPDPLQNRARAALTRQWAVQESSESEDDDKRKVTVAVAQTVSIRPTRAAAKPQVVEPQQRRTARQNMMLMKEKLAHGAGAVAAVTAVVAVTRAGAGMVAGAGATASSRSSAAVAPPRHRPQPPGRRGGGVAARQHRPAIVLGNRKAGRGHARDSSDDGDDDGVDADEGSDAEDDEDDDEVEDDVLDDSDAGAASADEGSTDAPVPAGERVGISARGTTFFSAVRSATATIKVGDWIEVRRRARERRTAFAPRLTARLLGVWSTAMGTARAAVQWAVLPEDTERGRLRTHDDREVFLALDAGVIPLSRIIRRARLLSTADIRSRRGARANAVSTDESCGEEGPPAPVRSRARIALFVATSFYDSTTSSSRALFADELVSQSDWTPPPLLLLSRVADGASSAATLLGPAAVGVASGTGALVSHFPRSSANGGGRAASAEDDGGAGGGSRGVPTSAAARAALALSVVPATLPGREPEQQQLEAALSAAIRGGGAGTAVYVSGLPGTGKTVTVTTVVRSLQAAAAAGTLPDFEYVEINAMRLESPHALYSVLQRALVGGEPLAPAKACAALEARFSGGARARSRAPKRVTLLVLDELDYLVTPKQTVLYNVFEWSTQRGSGLVVVGIANTMNMAERMLPKVSSRMGLCKIGFSAYSASQLEHILGTRLAGLTGFDQYALQMTSKKVASITGDVRRALHIMKRAIENAVARTSTGRGGTGVFRVTIEDVSRAATDLSSDPSSRLIASTPLLQKMFLLALVAEVRTSASTTEHSLDSLHRRALMLLRVHAPPSTIAAARVRLVAAARTPFDAVVALSVSADTEGAAAGAEPAAAPTLASYALLAEQFPACCDAWEEAALAMHEARIVTVSYPRALARTAGGPLAIYPIVSLVVGMDSVQIALRNDPLMLKISESW